MILGAIPKKLFLFLFLFSFLAFDSNAFVFKCCSNIEDGSHLEGGNQVLCKNDMREIDTPAYGIDPYDAAVIRSACSLYTALDPRFDKVKMAFKDASNKIHPFLSDDYYFRHVGETRPEDRSYFNWPEKVKIYDIGPLYEKFSEARTCLESFLGQPSDILWKMVCRPVFSTWLKDEIELVRSDPQLSPRERRDSYCRVVREVTKKTYFGVQYGNCGEGADVGYCLAHDVGFRDILRCTSRNDHAFVIYRHPGMKQICVLDRWNLFNRGVHFCDATIKGGVLIHPEHRTHDIKWFKDVSCGDPLDPDGVSVTPSDTQEFDFARWIEMSSKRDASKNERPKSKEPYLGGVFY